ncbi:MAG: hypothetical protein COW19_02855 [Zetaproteobacteria bacterium CG12_big_fil_rev_8_21_14_0_65_55_1124]|nr:MAG: hypothetical protein COT53_11020 [Zetaproteobacteria bacterium CG08_land_8_20_14_0_20_55_17]PIW43458.1 MAG: hypothetical protein COW19_02855 [Zetaproteobacteria bacterium CG12_big_fil_rev_8_21_14_0_65_55_1124]PIY53993.1 MAG: hypothetical protein COZ01_01925 [Zetaproteobacteria bacterium CG_4_10_14_0_8_um_filter_55_43]PIZ39296.1 MAG: hypothetical protein COY36_03475 [Zetaproteobacteria bacterium CG_4_10_14_0_2_um_filter_55_20]PJB81407.1 MAG: hypothetical protein CO089_04620 [Zetaproteoba
MPELNQVSLNGVLTEIRQRWTPDGTFAVIAVLSIARPALGAARANSQEMQPMPLRATGKAAEALNRLEGKSVAVRGKLRRRYYSRDNTPQWGQVEIWVDECHPIQVQEDEHG